MTAKKVEEVNVIDPEKFDESHRKKAALFQYMIGNADWGIHISKNIKYIRKEGKIIPVPYDFDFSALVSADYATLQSYYGQTSLEDRVYLGFETHEDELKTTIAYLIVKENNFFDTIENFKLLKRKERKEILELLQGFYDQKNTINFSNKHIGMVK